MGDDGAALAALAPCSCSNSPCRGNDRPRPCDTARPSHLARGPSRRCPAPGFWQRSPCWPPWLSALSGAVPFAAPWRSRMPKGAVRIRRPGASSSPRMPVGGSRLHAEARLSCEDGRTLRARLNLPEDAALLQGQSLTVAGALRPPSETAAEYYWGAGAGGLSHRERKRFPLRGEIA